MKLKMKINTVQFNRRLDSLAKKGEHYEDVNVKVYNMVANFFSIIMGSTPVWTGNLKGNWDLSLNSPKFRTYGSKQDPRSPMTAYQMATSKLVKWDMGKNQPIFITNAVDYAAEVNEEGSPNAPLGITDPAIEAIVSKYPFVKVK